MCYHVNDPQVGMGLTKNKDQFKMFVCDTGLFITLAFWDKSFTENIIYEKLLADKLPANLGYVYENLVSQMLVAAGNELFYHTWPRDEKHKSSSSKSHASLDEFCRIYSSRILWRYMVYTKDFAKDQETIMLPAYMVPFL